MTPELEGLHRPQELHASPERADARRAAHLVGREREEVTAECLHVDGAMRRGLCSVDDHDRASLMRPSREPLDRIDRAERVRDEVVGDDLDVAVARDRVEVGEVELAVVVERDHPELGARPLRDVLPRHEVRVVLELRDDDDVAWAEVAQTPGVGDEVQPLGRAADEDDLTRRRRVDEARDLLPRALVFGGRSLRQCVDAAVDVRVRRLVELPQLVEDLSRLVRADGGIEVGERLAVDLLLEDGEI